MSFLADPRIESDIREVMNVMPTYSALSLTFSLSPIINLTCTL